MEATNDLRHRINTTDSEGNPLQIDIRLNDECKNGHQDFSMTGTGWQKGKPRTDRWMMYGGCCHDAILKARPDLQIFADIHLCTAAGVPMHAIENGFYFLKEKGVKAAADYLRLTPEQAEQIEGAEDKIYLQSALERMGVPAQWKAEADQAIKMLEEWTGKKFVNDSKKRGFAPLTAEQVADMEEKTRTGYYTPEKIKAREEEKSEAAKQKKIADLKEQHAKKVTELDMELALDLAIIEAGYMGGNFIFYKHTMEVHFNWLDYEKKVSQEDFDAIVERVKPLLLQSGHPFAVEFKRLEKGR